MYIGRLGKRENATQGKGSYSSKVETWTICIYTRNFSAEKKPRPQTNIAIQWPTHFFSRGAQHWGRGVEGFKLLEAQQVHFRPFVLRTPAFHQIGWNQSNIWRYWGETLETLSDHICKELGSKVDLFPLNPHNTITTPGSIKYTDLLTDLYEF